jgi:glucoamylase
VRLDAERSAARTPTLVSGRHDVLDRVGLRVLRALQDPDGGVLAAPESDPDMRRSGGYGFVWARDLAFIVTAAAVAGRDDVVDGALRWLVRAQSTDGLYEQRHWSDGRVAPTWGLQLDETGAVLHAIGEVARVLDDPRIVERCWPTVRAGAEALARLVHPTTGLPPASLDAWEERVGVHTYTVAATIAGLEASARMADGRDDPAAARWRDAATRCRAGLDAQLWSEEHGRFLRSRDVARDDADGAPVPPGHQPTGRPAHPVASVDPVDATVDASLLGLAYPFAVLDHDDPRLVATIDAVERELRSGPGLLRYPGDTYVGGNPWLLTRLWLGLARREPGSDEPADGIDDVAGSATDAMLLAEQVDATTGRPVWIVPLAWSHAFYALACRPDHRAP